MRKSVLLLFLALMMIMPGAYSIYVAPCGPSTPPESCTADMACGGEHCVSMYEGQEKSASSKCQTNHRACETSVVCNQAGCQCGNSYGAFEGVDPASCITACQAPATAEYKGIESEAEATAVGWVNGILKSGDFAQNVGCGSELQACMDGAEAFSSPQILTGKCAGQVNEETYSQMLDKFGGESIEPYLNPQDPNALAAMESQGYQFQSAEQFQAFISKASASGESGVVSSVNAETFSSVANSQSTSVLADSSVQTALSGANVEISAYNEFLIMGQKVTSSKAFQAFSYGSTAVGVLGTVAGLSGGDTSTSSQDSAAYQSSQQSASSFVSSAQVANIPNSGKTAITTSSPTSNVRLPECASSAWVHDPSDGSYQCKDALHSGNEVMIGSIHILDNTMGAMFTLKGLNNHGIVYEDEGFANIHSGGTTRISVTSDEAAITDKDGNRLLLAGGTHIYEGTGSPHRDTFTTDTVIFNVDAQAAFMRTTDTDGKLDKPEPLTEATANVIRTITGKATYAPSDGTVALSMDHFNLPDYENAFDLSATVEGYQILARGFGNMVLMGKEKLFPLLSRGNLKGDTAIVFNKDVRVNNQYIARDSKYDYIITPADSSTQVIARSGKIIQDSGGVPRTLSDRQQRLLAD